MKKQIVVTVNGEQHTDEVEPRLLLVHYLRDDLRLTGTHVGCETSLCGACTVMLNGQAVKSCTVLAVQADGGEVLTVEGLEKDGKLHPLQDGFWEEHDRRCGKNDDRSILHRNGGRDPSRTRGGSTAGGCD